MGYVVNNKMFGVGNVKNIDDGIIEIEFDGVNKKFQFPKAFESFLKTDDVELLQMIDERKKIEMVAEKKIVDDSVNLKSQEISEKPKHCSEEPFERSINCPLVGERAQTIPVYSEAEMFELVGYMTTPGRVSSIEAEIPRDGRDKIFERIFPRQMYRPIEMGDTPSGLPNKLSPQFRINFASIRNCPEALRKNMGKGNGSCVGRINKSRFVIDMVQNYGFRFGEYQNVTAIRDIAENRGYLEAFEKGYAR